MKALKNANNGVAVGRCGVLKPADTSVIAVKEVEATNSAEFTLLSERRNRR